MNPNFHKVPKTVKSGFYDANGDVVKEKKDKLEKHMVNVYQNGTDPGKYICNFCYYTSLNFSHLKKNCFSVFGNFKKFNEVHVPHNDTITVSKQVILSKSLIETTRKCLS